MQFNSASAAARVSGTPVTMVVCMRGGEAWAGNALNRLNAQTEFRQRVRRIQLSHTPISRTKGIPLNGQAAPPRPVFLLWISGIPERFAGGCFPRKGTNE